MPERWEQIEEEENVLIGDVGEREMLVCGMCMCVRFAWAQEYIYA